MRRFLLVLLLLPVATAAQQPDVRLRVLSLYKIRQVVVVPGPNAHLRRCPTCRPEPLNQPVRLSVSGNRIRIDESQKTFGMVRLDNCREIRADRGPVRPVNAPLEIKAASSDLVLIAILPMEDYVSAVVQGETSGAMPPEALSAMAVAARTYATHFRQRHKAEGFDFCDTTHCQYVKPDISPAVSAAVRRSRGEILWQDGRPIAAYYHKDCGGKTEASADPWPGSKDSGSSSHDDPYCVRVSQPWSAQISRADISAALKTAGLRVPEGWNRIVIASRTRSGRARTLRLSQGSTQGGIPVAASSFRFALGRRLGWGVLKSDLYDIRASGDLFVFNGRGVGHGVGLCQTGAAEMATLGKSYREILAFYYPRATISVAAAGIEWRKISASDVDVKVVDNNSLSVADVAPRAFAWAVSRSGLRPVDHPTLLVYPDVEMFRNATGEPGWVAASTRGSEIRIQSPNVLGSKFEDVLRHEFVHLLLESNSSPRTPIWFREGMAMLITGQLSAEPPSLAPEKMEEILSRRNDERATQRAYASAVATVTRLESLYGRAELLRWLRQGIPSGVVGRSSHSQEASHDR